MDESYRPPFTMNEEITNLIVEIGEYVGSITTYNRNIILLLMVMVGQGGCGSR